MLLSELSTVARRGPEELVLQAVVTCQTRARTLGTEVGSSARILYIAEPPLWLTYNIYIVSIRNNFNLDLFSQ